MSNQDTSRELANQPSTNGQMDPETSKLQQNTTDELHQSLPTSFGWQSRPPQSKTFPKHNKQQKHGKHRGKHDFHRATQGDVGKRHFKPAMLEDPWKPLEEGRVRIGVEGMTPLLPFNSNSSHAIRTDKPNTVPIPSPQVAERVQNPDEIDLDSE